MNNKQIEHLATTVNPILAARAAQLKLNQLGADGGQPYMDAALQQFPNETALSFNGGKRYDNTTVVGRKEYSPVVNYLPKITEDISNFTFLVPPARQGGDEQIIQNINGMNDSVNVVMRSLNDSYTINNWSWLKVDIPAYNYNEPISIAEKQALGIRPFWYSLAPEKIVDWHYDRFGLQWAIEEDYEYLNTSPLTAHQAIKVRRVWEPGQVTIIRFNPSKDRRRKQTYSVEVVATGLDRVPLVLMGTPSAKPAKFDSFESINSSILNLESSNAQVFIDSAFPREFITESMLNRLYQQQLSRYTLGATQENQLVQVNEQKALDSAFQMAVGTKRPLVLGPGETPFTPSMPSGLTQIRAEIQAQVKQLMELSGVLLKKSDSAAESGLARAYDTLTVQSTVSKRADMLENAERQAIEISSEWDPDFTEWTVEYTENITEALVTSVDNMDDIA